MIISDLHLSKYRPKGHTLHFLHFIQSILPVVSPKFVVVTGDLTDAKDARRITSQQYLEEWQVYKYAIDQGVNVPWYDIRGNHDCFDLPSWQSKANLYRTYGRSAHLVEQGQGIYEWQVSESFGQYQFVAMDACPKKGPSRPLNFFGYLTSGMMDRLANAVVEREEHNHTFVFSHYPTTTMVFGVSGKGYGYRDLARRYSVYFCGHLHRLIAGLGDVLQSYNPLTKSLELELGDMKDHGMYRIVAVDHDLISFVDVALPLNQLPARPSHDPITPLSTDNKILWPAKIRPAPVVLITNPKDARTAIPTKEPLHRIRHSSHIRFLVFSEADPHDLQVDISVDRQPHPHPAQPSGAQGEEYARAPLWTSLWDPTQLDPRKSHRLRIQVVAPDGQMGVSEITFRLDETRVKIGGGAGEWIIATHLPTTLQCITLFSVAGILILLLVPKFAQANAASSRSKDVLLRIHELNQDEQPKASQRLRRHILVWALRFFRLSDDQAWVWHCSFVFVLALLSLPWFRAEFIPSGSSAGERYGTFYMWGLMFANDWVPIADTWMFAAAQVCLDVGVFLFLFAWRCTDAADLHCRVNDKLQQLNDYAWFRGLEIVYWLWRASEVVSLASFYGGVWPTLVQNLLVYWMAFVGLVLFWGGGGVFRPRQRGPRFIVQGCTACQQLVYAKQDEEVAPLMATRVTVQDESGSSSSSSSSSSSTATTGNSAASTPFNGSPQVKSRKKTQQQRESGERHF
ncbi:Transmembrane protein 62 [Apophysomyces sp. BC1021]|nr:Transmembrane protein 62 [Apophysomyces sp. BC1021]